MPAPVLREVVRRHAELAALMWLIYDQHLLNPEENPEMDDERLGRLIERLEAHLDALRIAGAEGREIAEERYGEFPEAGELFVVRMLQPGIRTIRIRDLDLSAVRQYLKRHLPQATPA
ncbi:hypothetical protein [Mesorhizobium sp.]|uniref:hypothetical protein n=1 Tax=Mesorhizobium sp. TaxID=1871066 RepID=UPI000FEA4796|nr:hypothetical protein [Mesorhizobium sp.]RWP27334.1 MAG: hypothetical protein EOR03_30950 [Mesorhizobium sp.]